MNNLLVQFHFLRPAWLLLLLPMLFLLTALYRKAGSGTNWRRAIAAELVDYLLEPGQQQRRRWIWLLATTWLLAVLAMAGPTWEKTPQPVLQKRDALVIVLDLSLSMYAEDIQPSRLERARYKILDILKQRREGLTGLVVYSGDAHVVSPLTDDTATIANLVPALAPAMMPSYGSDAAAGIEQAIQLLRNAGFERGRILLMSDEISVNDIDDLAKKIGAGNWQLSIMGVGTEQGAPIPTRDGFLKSNAGSIAIAQLHRENFLALAQKARAHYSDLQLDDSDIDALLPDNFADAGEARTLQREFDQWRERGPQLVMLLLPLAALAFRRGWLLILFLLPFSAPSQAQNWNENWREQWRDLWQRPDQQAQQLFSAGNSKDAAHKFSDPAWRAAAQYRSGDYENAAQTLSGQQNADAHYNRGNALAQANKLQDAVAAYNAALKANPRMQDAQYNRDLVNKLLQQQKNQPQNQSKQNDNQSDEKSQQDKSSQQQNAGDGQQQKSDSQSSNGTQNNPDKTQSRPDGSQKPSAADQQSDAAKKQVAQKPESASKDDRAGKDDATMQQQVSAASDDKSSDRQSSMQSNANTAESSEQKLQQRATEQWLRQIPDDPAGLLRRKFLYESKQRQREVAPRSDQPIW